MSVATTAEYDCCSVRRPTNDGISTDRNKCFKVVDVQSHVSHRLIAAAETPGAHRVEVDWPEGQDHPSSVAVDPSERAVDEEFGYLVDDVEVADAPQ